MPHAYRIHPSPIGDLLLVAGGHALLALLMGRGSAAPPPPDGAAFDVHGTDPILSSTSAQLDEYFAGTRTAFDLPLAAAGTPFQRSVWAALERVPYATTCSYADIARAIGSPNAVRAVGAANGRNPISIIVPCHRVIGADGSMTGYGGGLARKRWLLAHEARVRGPQTDMLADAVSR